jgi:hippurate hydrolase
MNAPRDASLETGESLAFLGPPAAAPLIDTDEVSAMQAWRRAIHQNPELGFEEHATSRLVADRLRDWGYEVTTGMAVTGVIGTLRWGDGSTGPRLGLRADMDALPIAERTGLPWASRVAGRMHACGHDGHTAVLLGAARRLAQAVAEARMGPAGTLHLIFQPAEELGGGGGAQRMIAEGLFDRFACDAVFALHNYPGMPVGHVYVRPGAFLASSDKVLIRFHGKGGHSAMPHLAADPALPAAATVLALQSIVARNLDPVNDTAVVTVGRLQAGQTYNVIAETAELELSVRTLSPTVRDSVHERIAMIAQGQAAAFGMRVEVLTERGYPVLMNDPVQTTRVAQTATAVLGADRVHSDAQPLPASEDFAYMLQAVPGCYLMIGNGDNGHEGGRPSGPCNVHNPHFDFNDACLPVGASLWVSLAQAFFTSDAP